MVADRLIAQRYRLLSELAPGQPSGGGALRNLWVARDEMLCREVTLEVLCEPLAADSVFLQRFQREAATLGKLIHPHIVATYDAGVDNGLAFLVTELVRGPTLREFLDGDGLPARDVVPMGLQLADALAHAHARGVIHGNITSSNILVAPGGQTKLAGFGLADQGIAGESTANDDLRALGGLLQAMGRAMGQAVTNEVATPPRARPLPHRYFARRRRWLALGGAACVLVGGLTWAGAPWLRDNSPAGATAEPAVRITDAGEVDPLPGNGEEDARDVRLIFDHDPATGWSTDQYTSPEFGRLKQGVGIWVRLDQPKRIRSVEVITSAPGWAAEIHGSSQPAALLAQWGAPLAKGSGLSTQHRFDLDFSGQVVLIWLTRLPPSGTIEIREVNVDV